MSTLDKKAISRAQIPETKLKNMASVYSIAWKLTVFYVFVVHQGKILIVTFPNQFISVFAVLTYQFLGEK